MAKILEDVNAEDTRVSHLSRLKERKDRIDSGKHKFQAIHFAIVSLSIIFPVAAIIVLFVLGQTTLFYSLIISTAVYFSTLLLTRSKITTLDQDSQAIEFEIDLLQFDVSSRETRAEKVLRINDLQLRRYYSLNLSQNIWVFGLGIVCILLGLGVIGITMYIIVAIQSDIDTKIVTAIVGSIGSFLSSYVAAIYLKMHAAAASHLGSFHSRLVETHQLLLGNLLASRIEDDQKRWETLSQLALNMAKMSQ